MPKSHVEELEKSLAELDLEDGSDAEEPVEEPVAKSKTVQKPKPKAKAPEPEDEPL
jgi:hypothetical protein